MEIIEKIQILMIQKNKEQGTNIIFDDLIWFRNINMNLFISI